MLVVILAFLQEQNQEYKTLLETFLYAYYENIFDIIILHFIKRYQAFDSIKMWSYTK